MPGRLILCAVTGAHHYGFPSPDSDIDLKAVHLAPTTALLGLDPVQETFDRIEDFEGVECDLTTHEARKALGLLLRGNGNLIERLSSPYQVVGGPDCEALQQLLPATLSRRCHSHYAGYCRAMQAEHLRDGHRAKSLLYSFRVALTGVHLLKTGECVAHLPTLADLYGFPELHEVVAHKRRHSEKTPLPEGESERHRERWPELLAMLDEALERSILPEQPPDRGACADWLVQTRLAGLK